MYIFIKQIYQKNLALDNLNLPTFPIVDFFQNGDLLLSGLVANQVVTGRGNISTPLQFIQDPCFGDDGFNKVYLVRSFYKTIRCNEKNLLFTGIKHFIDQLRGIDKVLTSFAPPNFTKYFYPVSFYLSKEFHNISI